MNRATHRDQGEVRVNEDEIQRAVARGIRDYEKSRPKPKGIIDEASSAACGCIALFVAALVVMGIVVA
ncbi:hypothetical protein GCM10010431_26990 [Streptomyces kunmingensis]